MASSSQGVQPPEHAMHEWVLGYNEYRPAQEGLREALCTLGNGYVATRGAAPDCGADAVHYPGTYLAGGYNRLTTTIAGRDVENEDLVNLPNWLPLTMRIDDGAWMCLDTVEIVAYRQELDLRQGCCAAPCGSGTRRAASRGGRNSAW